MREGLRMEKGVWERNPEVRERVEKNERLGDSMEGGWGLGLRGEKGGGRKRGSGRRGGQRGSSLQRYRRLRRGWC